MASPTPPEPATDQTSTTRDAPADTGLKANTDDKASAEKAVEGGDFGYKKSEKDVDDTTGLPEDLALNNDSGVDPAFYAKIVRINAEIAQLGFGKYQWLLFIALQAISINTPAIGASFAGQPKVKLLVLAEYVGLVIGATFWGMSADVVGRRIAWNSTLFLSGVFGMGAGGANDFVTLGAMIACLSFGVGGQLPVDSALYLEFLPPSHDWTLTALGASWAVGQVIASLISWAFLAKYSCPTPPDGEFCPIETNRGWQYAYLTLGALILFSWALRFWILPMFESPKYLCSVGRDEQAVAVIHKVAKMNGRESTLTVEDLYAVARPYMSEEAADAQGAAKTKLSTWGLVKHSFSDVSSSHIKGLFATKRLGWSTTLLIASYALLGFAYPLYNAFLGTFLAQKTSALGSTSLDDTYAAYTYQAACGVPGSLLAAWMVRLPRVGRKYSMAFFTAAAGVFLFGLTAATTLTQVNVLTSFAAFFENAFYSVLFAFAPESFPMSASRARLTRPRLTRGSGQHSVHRGTGDAITSASSRVTGLIAPIIAVYSDASKTPNGPVYVSAAIFIFTAVLMCFIPIETRGRVVL